MPKKTPVLEIGYNKFACTSVAHGAELLKQLSRLVPLTYNDTSHMHGRYLRVSEEDDEGGVDFNLECGEMVETPAEQKKREKRLRLPENSTMRKALKG